MLETVLTPHMQSVNTLQIAAWILDLGVLCGAKQVCLSKTWAHQSEEWGSPWGQDRKTNLHRFVSVGDSSFMWTPALGLVPSCRHCSPLLRVETWHTSGWGRLFMCSTDASEDDLRWSSSIEWHLTALGVRHCRVLQHKEDSCNRICFKLVSTSLASVRAR